MHPDPVTALLVGRSTLDIVYACAGFPDADGKVDAEVAYKAGGGPALNAAVAFAGLGGQAKLLSVVGEGPFADWVRGDIGRYGVQLIDAAAGETDVLPVSSVILSGAHRAIVNQPLPSRAGDAPGDLVGRLFEACPAIVLSDGHLPELALPVLQRAREMGVTTVLDGGSWKEWTPELLPFVDVAVVSARFRPPGMDDVLTWLAGRIARVAVTRGGGPIRWRDDGASGAIDPPQVEAVDTLGAGDIFHGAFCHALANGGDFPASLRFAAGVASGACAVWGPRAWIGEAPRAAT